MAIIRTTDTLSTEDQEALRNAKQKMEQVSWAMQGLNQMGNLIDKRIQLLPKKQQQWLQQLSYNVLHTVVNTNLLTMRKGKVPKTPLNLLYKAMVTSSGAVGGAFGATAFAVDLGIATKLMMRSIMDIARSEGENLTELDTQLACLQVFALGGKTKHDDSLDTGYYATRIALNAAVKGSSGKLIEGLLVGTGSPVLRLVSSIASRFSIQVSEKFVAQAIPLIGAVGGASINLAFIQHFQNMAQAHFSIRRLERKYGEALIRQRYEEMTVPQKQSRRPV
ncbi:EcsC family protein [Pseudozobellia thermophila]|uniref:EcsC protein family protein n=1 Tax=Pseudozobellia thermophila TaxID=192903 RepID=A0A1M6BZF4_9FLAO|nr:EcsC family protein [Pseudozobellia thermophila]SHI53991.1 EcsC protein family protein [Pseudozobellia thermophila]